MKTWREEIKEQFKPVFGPLPMDGREAFWLRLFFAILVVWMMAGEDFSNLGSQDKPTGLARLMDLTFLARGNALLWVKIGVAGLMLPYVFGLGLPVVLPLVALIHAAVFSFFNSQGYTSHGNQIVSLMLVGQTLVALFFPVYRMVAGRPFVPRGGKRRESYLLYATMIMICGVYMTSVVSKMRKSDGRWLRQLPNVAVQVIKTHRQTWYSNPEDPKGVAPGVPVPKAAVMLENPLGTQILLGAGLVLEWFCFLCLANRGWALLVGLSLIGMHRSIDLIMHLTFGLNEWASAIFLVNVPFWVMWFLRRRRERRDSGCSLPTSR